MDSIFVDTNALRGKTPSLDTFFAHIKQFEQSSRVAKICIPSMVIEELKRQKIVELERQLSCFKRNHFSSQVKFTVDNLEGYIGKHVDGLYKNSQSEFDYTEIELVDDIGHVDTLKAWAIKNHPPFERHTDKGFKDACICLTIQQYIDSGYKGEIFLISDDGRLKDFFEKHEHVTLLESIDAYEGKRALDFTSPYFVETLQKHFDDATISVKHVREIELTEDDDWQMVINTIDKESLAYMVECSDEDSNPSVKAKLPRINHQLLVDFASKEIISDERI